MKNTKRESIDEFMHRKDLEFNQRKPIIMKDILRNGHHSFIRESWTWLPQSNMEDKVFLIERLVREEIDINTGYKGSFKTGDIEYRIGYFIMGRIGRRNDKWTWGQFCPVIPINDFNKLIEKAKEEGTLL